MKRRHGSRVPNDSTSSRTSQNRSVEDHGHASASLTFSTCAAQPSGASQNGLKSSSAMADGRPHWCNFRCGLTITERAGIIDAPPSGSGGAALFALEPQDFKGRPPAGYRTATTTVVKEGTTILKHALLVVDDDCRTSRSSRRFRRSSCGR